MYLNLFIKFIKLDQLIWDISFVGISTISHQNILKTKTMLLNNSVW